SSEFMMEGDIVVPRTRTAMKCFNKAYSCLWRKSSSGRVEIPFIISEVYGRLDLLQVSPTGSMRLLIKLLQTPDQTETTEILLAMRAVEKKTCIRFIPRTRQRAYLSIEPRSG
ncbi:unnamed protein product, partial [Lampetra planeri]